MAHLPGRDPLAWLGYAIALAVWSIISATVETARVPSPMAVLIALLEAFRYSALVDNLTGYSGYWWPHMLRTSQSAIGGGIAGLLLGVSAGLLLARFRHLRLALYVPVEALRALPPLALLPLFLMWFGAARITAMAFITLYAFRMLLINTLNAVDNAHPVHAQYAMTLGANQRQVFRTIWVPQILPELLGGARVALAIAWGVTVIAELMGGRLGIGRLISHFIPLVATSQIMAAMIWVAIFATITDRLLTLVWGKYTEWAPESITARAG